MATPPCAPTRTRECSRRCPGSARPRTPCRARRIEQQLIDAINILVNVHGAGSFAESSPLQRYWRDANTAARHAGLYEAVGYEVFGKSMLGIDEQISPMV